MTISRTVVPRAAVPRAVVSRVVVLGCGFAGEAVARLSMERGLPCLATSRSEARVEALRARGIDAVVASLPDGVDRLVREGDGVVVTFPPDGRTDAAVVEPLRRASAWVYVSSTGVYGDARGRVIGTTPTDASTPRSALRLEAEELYRALGGVVLRAPGIYGPGRGLHVRLAAGRFRLPGDGSRAISRIHVDDLAAFVVAALERGSPSSVHAVGDDAPVPQREVVAWLVERLGVPFPPSAPLDDVDETLRHDRRVDASVAKEALGVSLRYPTYREGFAACLAAESKSRAESKSPQSKSG